MIRRIRVRRCEVPFVILFRERTGSTHLCSILNNHPEIVCRREDFFEVEITESSPLPANGQAISFGNSTFYRRIHGFDGSFIDCPTTEEVGTHLHDLYSCPVKACGFKFKFSIQTELFHEVISELKSFAPDLRVIALSRRNLLKQAISRQNMLRIAEYSGGKKCNLKKTDEAFSNLSAPFHVDVEAVINYVRYLKKQDVEFSNFVQELQQGNQVPLHTIEYENLLENQEQVVRSTFEYLSVNPDAKIRSSIRKATPDNLAVAVENFNELYKAIIQTEFASFVED